MSIFLLRVCIDSLSSNIEASPLLDGDISSLVRFPVCGVDVEVGLCIANMLADIFGCFAFFGFVPCPLVIVSLLNGVVYRKTH